jgi:excinuclease ABC subunit C
MPDQALLESVNRFPESPGVYFMRDAAGVPLYIGKAVNLRSRVKSYFLDGHQDRPQIPFMLARLHQIDWIATRNETEALILEANLIRKHRPKFNIDLKDDKHYPYLKVTVNEPFPRLLVTRRVESDGAKYFGPYTDVRAMRRVMHFAQRIFRMRDCGKRLPLGKQARPCVNFEMGRCSGACAGKIDEKEYRTVIDMLIRFLSGRRKDLVGEFRAEMERAAAELRFEEAGLLRDQLRLVQDAIRMQQVDLKVPDIDCDVFGFYKGDRTLCLAVLQVREGLLLSVRSFAFDKNAWEASQEGAEALLLQYYLAAGDSPPDEVLACGEAGIDPALVAQALKTQFSKKVEVGVPQKGAKRLLCDIAIKNARLYLMQKLPPDALADLQELQSLLGLPRFPHVIEAFDISNLGETNAVAGMVRFVDGRPDKSGYRRYKIKTVSGQDDFAMMMEAVTRRLSRQKEDGVQFADLFLIDGGVGQLHSAMEPLGGLSNPPMVISLAKKEELLHSPYRDAPVRLPSTHPVRKFLERIRDEAHRFAISYHRALRGRLVGASALHAVPGMGRKRTVALLRRFGSVRRLREATVEEIASVKGLPLSLAKDVKAFLDKMEIPEA